MLAIHKSLSGFHSRWKEYCEINNIPFKSVDCFSNNLIDDLKGSKALIWHHSQNDPRALIAAKPILFALEHSGVKVFPDFKTNWHFDDKLGQKYLFESLGISIVPTYAFYEEMEALNWISKTDFPKVFKLRGGAGSSNVRLAKSESEGRKIIKQAFGKGFANYNSIGNFNEIFRKWRLKKADIVQLLKGFVRLFSPPQFSKVMGREMGYVLFQDFIPNNNYDIRVVVIGDKAFAIKRMVRENDFRASGSGNIRYEKDNFPDSLIKLSFEINKKIQSQSLAIDFVFDEDKPLVVEISYGFDAEVYDPCPGYWDSNLKFHSGRFDPYGWMVENLLNS